MLRESGKVDGLMILRVDHAKDRFVSRLFLRTLPFNSVCFVRPFVEAL